MLALASVSTIQIHLLPLHPTFFLQPNNYVDISAWIHAQATREDQSPVEGRHWSGSMCTPTSRLSTNAKTHAFLVPFLATCLNVKVWLLGPDEHIMNKKERSCWACHCLHGPPMSLSHAGNRGFPSPEPARDHGAMTNEIVPRKHRWVGRPMGRGRARHVSRQGQKIYLWSLCGGLSLSPAAQP